MRSTSHSVFTQIHSGEDRGQRPQAPQASANIKHFSHSIKTGKLIFQNLC